MPRIVACLIIILFSFALAEAQNKAQVEVLPKILATDLLKSCKNFQYGKIVFYQKPDYPNEAKNTQIGGIVEVTVKVDEKGRILEVEKITGNRLLQGAAAQSAIRGKFTPTFCDGKSISISALMIYNFIPQAFGGNYFHPTKIEDFPDIAPDSQFYEPILYLTENFKLAFGYSDKKFHPEAPLTRGDFANFLRLTLDLLSQRAKMSNRNPRQIGLFSPYNPQKITSAGKIPGFKDKQPFSESVKILLQNYEIALLDKDNNFQGSAPMTDNETIELWTKIFGADAVPINFMQVKNAESFITRGEFALFLSESLEILTYKVLP